MSNIRPIPARFEHETNSRDIQGPAELPRGGDAVQPQGRNKVHHHLRRESLPAGPQNI